MAKSYIICLYTTLLLVGLAACVAVQPSGRLLGGLVPQMSPCWLDICPGRTQAREAWAHLRNQIIPLGGEIQDNGDSLYSSIATADDAASTWAFVHDGVVYTIAFEGPQVSLGQVGGPIRSTRQHRRSVPSGGHEAATNSPVLPHQRRNRQLL